MENKGTVEMSAAELELREVYALIGRLEKKIEKMEAVVDGLYCKALVSHSLIIPRKINEEKLSELDSLLD